MSRKQNGNRFKEEAQKFNTERILEKHFNLDVDYKNLTPKVGGARISPGSPENTDVKQEEKLDTIAKAAESENMCAAKMSRSIKNAIIFNNDYYYCIKK
jgi:hypothetical protein